MPAVTEMQLTKLQGRFPANDMMKVAQIIKNENVPAVFYTIDCLNNLWFNCISVTDDININEQNKSIGKGQTATGEKTREMKRVIEHKITILMFNHTAGDLQRILKSFINSKLDSTLFSPVTYVPNLKRFDYSCTPTVMADLNSGGGGGYLTLQILAQSECKTPKA